MNKLLKQILLVCACVFALIGHASADPVTDAEKAFKLGNYTKAVKLFRPLAEQGNATAQFSLGGMYLFGLGVPLDFKEAVKWTRLAAEQGNAPAQHNLGVMYATQGVPDYQEAVKWVRLAAEQGYALAQVDLGVSYYARGQGVPQDYVRAHMWTNIAAANADSVKRKNYIATHNSLEKNMTASQVAEAQELARKCTANKFKGC